MFQLNHRQCSFRIHIVFVVLSVGFSRALSRPMHHYNNKRVLRTTDYRYIKQQKPSLIRQQHQSSSTHHSLLLLETIRGGNQELDEHSEKDSKLSLSTAASVAALPMASFSKFYVSSLQQSPILTKSITAGIVFALSDILAQRLERKGGEKGKKLSMNRIVASIIVGFAYFGPAAHYWYEWIFRIIPGTTFYCTVQKAALGQLLFGPSFTCIFFASSLIQSKTFTLRTWFQKIKQDLPGAVLAGVGFWPIVDFISYSLISPQYIPLFINFCSLIWTTYLALKSYSK